MTELTAEWVERIIERIEDSITSRSVFWNEYRDIIAILREKAEQLKSTPQSRENLDIVGQKTGHMTKGEITTKKMIGVINSLYWDAKDDDTMVAIRVRLREYDALKAEVRRLTNAARIALDNEAISRSVAEKAEAELAYRAAKEKK